MTVDNAQVRAPNHAVLAELNADIIGIIHEEVMVQNNLDGENKEDILLPRAETKTVLFFWYLHSFLN
jgi:hypothetical protein